jgi:hypothetical protein
VPGRRRPDRDRLLPRGARRRVLTVGSPVLDKVWFLDKSGHTLINLDGSPGVYPIALYTLFSKLTPINANLGLPTTNVDGDGNRITVANGYGLNCDKATSGVRPLNWSSDRNKDGIVDDRDFYWPKDTCYDARVLFDETDQRFVIGALFINNNTPYRTNDLTAPGSRSRYVSAARRSGLAVAVSSSSDSRRAWYT